MNKFRRGLSKALAALILTASVMTAAPVRADEAVVYPEVNLVFPNHMNVEAGDTQSFFVTSDYEGMVQYKLWFQGEDGKWIDTEYSEEVDAKIPYEINTEAEFQAGKNAVVVWVKRAGEEGHKVSAKVVSKDTNTYDAYNLKYVNVKEDVEVNASGELDYTVDGLNVTVNGIEGVDENNEFLVFAYDYQTNEWLGEKDREWTVGSAELALPEAGTYLIDVWTRTPGAETWEALKLDVVTISEDAAQTIEVFETTVNAAAFGATVNVTMTADGTSEFTSAAKYQVFDGAKAISAVADLEAATTIYPAKAEGDAVTIKLLDASEAVVETFEVALGEKATFEVAENNGGEEVVEGSTTATVKAAAFGATINVATENTSAAKYQIFDGAKAISAVADLEAATTIYPAKAAGDVVTIKLLDASGAVVETAEVTLAE